MNITERIIARASSRQSVCPGDAVFADIDCAMMHDVSGPGVIKVIERLKGEGIEFNGIWDPDKVWIAEDHFVPSAEKASAENTAKLSAFTEKYGIKKHFKYGLGEYGICHTLSHEDAMVMPGQLYVGGDSHTNTTGALGAFACGLGHTDMAYVMFYGRMWFRVPETIYFKLNGKLKDHVMAKDVILRIIGDIGTDGAAYRAMQFGGNAIAEMSVEDRLTLTNMTTEAGAKNGIIEADQKVGEYLRVRGAQDAVQKCSTADAIINPDMDSFADVHEYDVSEFEPVVAKPFSPQNISVVREAPTVDLNKAYLGSCTGAKMEDLEAAARILKGRKVKIRTEVLPASISIFKRALDRGLVSIFLDAGAVVGPPTCGACCGAHMGVLGKEEICVSATNRNFPGRMGHIESQTYLASPMVVAASAVTGHLTDPRDL